MIENQENVILAEVRSLKGELGSLRGEMNIRFDEAYKLTEGAYKLTEGAYKLAQRANVLLEKNTSDIQQVAEAVYNERLLKKRVEEHDDRISSLEWRSDMHEKAIKKVMNG